MRFWVDLMIYYRCLSGHFHREARPESPLSHRSYACRALSYLRGSVSAHGRGRSCSVQLQARIAAHLGGLLDHLLVIRSRQALDLPERPRSSRNSRRARPKVLLSEAGIRGSDGASMSLSVVSVFDSGAPHTRKGRPLSQSVQLSSAAISQLMLGSPGHF